MGALPCYDKKKQESVIEPIKRVSVVSQSEKQPQPQRLSQSSVEVEQHKNPQEDQVEEVEEYEEESEENDVEYIQGDLIQEGTNVYSALNTLNGQLLAIKLFYLEEDEDLNIIQDRVEVFRKLRHKNIHEILDYDYQEQRKLWILMPYESGGSISWLLQKFSKFSPHLAAVFMKQILQGLDYLHQNKIMHKNLKTSNVLVDVDTNAKLSDISILNHYGVSSYSAPELFAGGEYTTYSDIWSAGCIFIEMLTRYNPWQFESHTITIEQIRTKLQLGKIFQFRNMVRDSETLRILQLIFKANPSERLSASQLLELDYFKNLQTDQMASLIQQSAVHQTKQVKKSLKMNNANSLQQSHRSSVKKSLSTQSKEVLLQILNSVKIADIDILRITEHGNGGHQSLSHMDLQNVLSKRQKSLFSRIIPGISQSIIANDQNPVNRLISEGIIRQQGNTKVEQAPVAQQLVGKNTVKPPLMIKRHSPHDSDNFKQLQTDRSQQVVSDIIIEQNREDLIQQDQDGYRSPKLVQQLLGNKASEKPPLKKKHSPHGSEKSSLQSDIIVEENRPDTSNAFESLMRHQFESNNENTATIGPQELEDLMCQQYYQARKDLYQDIKLPSEVVRDMEKAPTQQVHDNEYFERLMNQQYESDFSKASSLQQPVNADDLEELMCQQYYQALNEKNNIHVNKDTTSQQKIKVKSMDIQKEDLKLDQKIEPIKQVEPVNKVEPKQEPPKMDDKYFENLMNQQFDSDNSEGLDVDELEELMCKQYYQARDEIQNAQPQVPNEHAKDLNIRHVKFEESYLEEPQEDIIIPILNQNIEDQPQPAQDNILTNTNIIVIKQRTPVQEPIKQQEIIHLIDLDKIPQEPRSAEMAHQERGSQQSVNNIIDPLKVIQFDKLESQLAEEEEEEDNFIVLF